MSTFEVAKTNEIPSGKMKTVSAGNKELVIFNVDGNFYALPRRCTHMDGDLSQGVLEGKFIECPRHHARFDITTGACVANPRIGPLRLPGKDEEVYKVTIKGDGIWLDL